MKSGKWVRSIQAFHAHLWGYLRMKMVLVLLHLRSYKLKYALIRFLSAKAHTVYLFAYGLKKFNLNLYKYFQIPKIGFIIHLPIDILLSF